MNWALAVAIAWCVLVLPAGYLLGRALLRADAREAASGAADRSRAGEAVVDPAPPEAAVEPPPSGGEPETGAPAGERGSGAAGARGNVTAPGG